jgi:hypothetical protein
MDDRIKQIIGRHKNKISVDEDTNINLTIDNTTRVIKPNANPINSVVGVDEQFDLEREDSSLYRLLGRINVITANELTQGNSSGSIRGTVELDWDPLFTEFYNGTSIVKTPNNWLLQICYPSSMDENYNLWGTINNHKPVSLGIRVDSLTSNNPSGNRSLLVVTTTQKHKLSEGDYIHLNNRRGSNQYQGIHKVFEIGDNGDGMTTKVTLETSWKGNSSSEMFLNRVANSSNNDVLYDGSNTLVSFTNTDITGGTTNSNYVLVKTPNEHGLGKNGYVEMRKTDGSLMNGFHRVHEVIDKFNFTIQPPNVITSVGGLTYRRMDGTPSEYYVREFELLTGNNYETYPAAFSSSVYPETTVSEFGVANKTWLFNLTKDVNTGSLISHRGGVVNELKLCMLKRSGANPYNWSNVTSHWDFNSLLANTSTTTDLGNGTTGIEVVSYNNTSGAGTIVKNTPKTLTQSGSKYIGDIVEYNRKEIKEKVISEVIFRFGLESGVLTNNNIPENPQLVNGTETETTGGPLKDLEGYYYNPFKTLDIKKFSNTIERADPEDVIDGIPADYEQYPNGSKAWRDLLTNGFIEEGTNGVDWPFLSGRHYVYMNNCIYIRRQNPYVVIDQSDIITVNPKNAC